jgi:hypothetical protein
MVVFRSLAIPLTAAIMNLLSAAAAFGVITAVFQWGWLKSLVGVTNTGPISPFIPILMFAVLFGLTTDYQVFLVSRIQEEWLKRRDNSAAVHIGQAATGRIISAAAAIMTVVFFAFTFTTDRTIKMIGLGMAAAVVTDALVVRTVLVPAVMHTLGKTNWRIPRASIACSPTSTWRTATNRRAGPPTTRPGAPGAGSGGQGVGLTRGPSRRCAIRPARMAQRHPRGAAQLFRRGAAFRESGAAAAGQHGPAPATSSVPGLRLPAPGRRRASAGGCAPLKGGGVGALTDSSQISARVVSLPGIGTISTTARSDRVWLAARRPE